MTPSDHVTIRGQGPLGSSHYLCYAKFGNIYGVMMIGCDRVGPGGGGGGGGREDG